MKRFVAMLLVLVLMTSCFVGGTFAKYTTADSASDTARVAKWGITVSTSGTLFGKFYQGTTNIGTLQIWEIYELWCFIKVKQMILRILQLDPQSPLITEPHGSLVHYQRSLLGNKSADYRVVIQYPTIDDTLVANEEDAAFAEQLTKHQGDVISIHYQHTFSRVREDDFDVRTMTTEQRPDIIVNIKKANGEVLTYLYDAKYRVWSDSNLDKTEDWYERDNEAMELLQGADYPPADGARSMGRTASI
mgnify:CR=1 FL=1